MSMTCRKIAHSPKRGMVGLSRRVLLVAYVFPPVGGIAAQRPLKFARYLPQFGWETTVLTTRDADAATIDPDLEKEIPDEVKVVRIRDPLTRWMRRMTRTSAGPLAPETRGEVAFLSRPSLLSRLKSPLVRFVRGLLKATKRHLLIPDEAVLFALRAAWTATQLVRADEIACIYTTSGPNSVHLVGWLVHKVTGVPWVADFRDPWTDNMHFKFRGLRKIMERWLESRVFLHAAHVVTVTESFRTGFEHRHPAWAGRIRVIRNGVDPSDFPTLWSLPKPGPFVLFYAGILYPSRNPKTVLQAVATAIRYHRIHTDDIRVVFAGVFDYPGSDENRRLVQDLGLDNVVVELGYLPRKRVLEQLQTADALLLIGDRALQANQYIPGKLYEYLYAKRPILALLQKGEAADLISELRAGVVINPDDVQAVASQLVTWVRQKRKGSWPLPDAHIDSRRLAPFTRLGQTAELARVLDEMFPEEKSGRMTGNL